MKEHWNPDHLWFCDDILGLKPGWLESFADCLEKQRLRIPFKCLSRADLLLRGNTISALQRAGCRIVWMGAESGSQKVLNAMEKGITVDQIHEATTRLRARNIRVAYFLQFGYPGETLKDILKTFQLVHRNLPDDIGISVSYPLPGTPFYERVREQLGTKQNWMDSYDLAMLLRGPYPTPFYRRLHAFIHRSFRIHRFMREPRRLKKRKKSSSQKGVRKIFRLIADILLLPVDILFLTVFAIVPHRGIQPIQPRLSYSQASTPSPTLDEEHEHGGA